MHTINFQLSAMHAHMQVEAEMMAHIAAAEKKSNILERQLTQVTTTFNMQCATWAALACCRPGVASLGTIMRNHVFWVKR